MQLWSHFSNVIKLARSWKSSTQKLTLIWSFRTPWSFDSCYTNYYLELINQETWKDVNFVTSISKKTDCSEISITGVIFLFGLPPRYNTLCNRLNMVDWYLNSCFSHSQTSISLSESKSAINLAVFVQKGKKMVVLWHFGATTTGTTLSFSSNIFTA